MSEARFADYAMLIIAPIGLVMHAWAVLLGLGAAAFGLAILGFSAAVYGFAGAAFLGTTGAILGLEVLGEVAR